MARTFKNRHLPTPKEAVALKRIAMAGGLIVTHVNGHDQYSTADGMIRIEKAVAEKLIFRGWVIGDRGDALFDCIPQRYRVLSVASGGESVT